MSTEDKNAIMAYMKSLDIDASLRADPDMYVSAVQEAIAADYDKMRLDDAGAPRASAAAPCGWEQLRMYSAIGVMVAACTSAAVPVCIAAGAAALLAEAEFIACLDNHYSPR